MTAYHLKQDCTAQLTAASQPKHSTRMYLSITFFFSLLISINFTQCCHHDLKIKTVFLIMVWGFVSLMLHFKCEKDQQAPGTRAGCRPFSIFSATSEKEN